MNGFADAIKYFYQQFLLRDLLGYVTPGALVLATALFVASSDLQAGLQVLRDLPSVTYLVIFGLSFAVGFALQNVGERLRILRWHYEGDQDPSDGYLKDKAHLQRLFDVHQAASYRLATAEEGSQDDQLGEWAAQIRERIAVKKNMTGTHALGLIVSIFLLAFGRISAGHIQVDLVDLAVLFVAAVVIAGLLRGHRKQLAYQHIWEGIVLSQAKKKGEMEAD